VGLIGVSLIVAAHIREEPSARSPAAPPRHCGKDLRVFIVGTQHSPRLLALSTHLEVTVIGAVPDLASYYRDAEI